MLKNLLLAICFLLSIFKCEAGHEHGGIIITYRSLENLNGNSLEYEVTVHSLWNVHFINPPTVMNITLSSNCFPTTSLPIPIINSAGPSLPLHDLFYCAPNTISFLDFVAATHRDTIVLPGTCNRFKFSTTTLINRFGFTNNILSIGESYFFITLNNLKGPNSSPQILPSDILKVACLLNPLRLYGFIEEDGDSVVYSAAAPMTIDLNSVIVNATFNPGYSIANPVNSPTGYNVDPSTGIVPTSLNQQGHYALAIKYLEYRMDTTLGYRVLISKGRFIMYLIGSSNCSLLPIEIDHTLNPNSDSLQCGEKQLKIRTTRKAEYSTLTSSGSEFNIISTIDPSLTIIGAQFLSDTVIELELNQPVVSNDTLMLTISMGNDTNTILSICGKEILANNDTLLFYSTIANSINPQFSYSTNLLEVDFTSSLADSVVWNFGDGTTYFN